MRTKCVGTHWLSVILYLDRLERVLGIELLHHHDRAAKPLGGGAPADRCGVIERRGREIDHAAIGGHAGAHHREAHQRIGREDVVVLGRRGLDPLGPSGGARGIEHVLSRRLVGDRLGRLRGERGFVIFLALAIDDQQRQVGAFVADALDRLGIARAGEQELGSRILKDVADLRRGQPGRDRHHHRARTLRAPHHLQVMDIVFHQHCEMVAALEPACPQQLRKAVRIGVHFREGHGLAAARHDHRGMVGARLRMGNGVHDGLLSPVCRSDVLPRTRPVSRRNLPKPLAWARKKAAGSLPPPLLRPLKG
jgi:hypothetical protein